MKFARIILLSLLLVPTSPAATPKKPKIVVAVVIDQFRYDYLLRFRKDYNSGLARLLDRGAVFTDAHYLHNYTVTAVGHSTFLTGAPPSMSGIIGNQWFDRDLGKQVTSVSDAETQLVGAKAGAEGSSPRRLLVSTVGDELKMQGGDSKVIGVSIKDRSAILPAGHMADGAYWFDADANRWVTSTWFRPDLPEWAEKVNSEKHYEKYLAATWYPFDAKEGTGKPLCTMVKGTEVRYCGSLEATPWGNELIEEFAERALAGEKLGHHNGTDILTVSFSSNDYVGHAVGPDDPAVRDIAIRTDRLLGKLLDAIDQSVGPGNALVVLTADHGVVPLPEVNRARHMPGGRIATASLTKAISDALVKRFGPGNWLLPGGGNMPYLNQDLIRTHNLDAAEVERVAADAALKEPHIARVYTRHDIQSGRVQQDDIGRAVTLGFYGPRYGDLLIIQEPYYLFEATGTSHGTPYGYDNHVPVLFMGSGIKPGQYSGRIAVNDIAPTLSTILGVDSPSGSIGRTLGEMFQ